MNMPRSRLGLAGLGLRPFARTGPVRAARTVNAGLNSQLTVVLDTDAGWVFVKGLRWHQQAQLDVSH